MKGPSIDYRLKSQRFRQEREADWRRLEKLMDKAEKGSAAKLTDAEILAIPVLYRSTLSALSVARETSLDRGLVDYLETLSARAYFFVYGSRSTLQASVAEFFTRSWPASVRSLWLETLASLLLTLIGMVAAMVLIGQDPDWFATFLFTHNAQVALLAFALGFAFCLPSALLMLSTGAMVGAFLVLFASRGLGFELGGWLLIHGVTELFAVILAGAAGLRIGWAAAFPGELSRLDAVAAAGRTASIAMAGVVVMLFLAGLLEGFGRQLITNDFARYGVALGTGLLWAAYFYGPRREPLA